MLLPVLCLTCGCPIGDIEDIFRKMRADKVRKALEASGTAPALVAIEAGFQVSCEDIFEALHVRMDCCRKVLTTNMLYSDYY